MDAFLEFLTENAQRRYPFTEDCSSADLTDTFELADDVVLDVRGFHRERTDITPRLAAIAGPDADLNEDYPAVAGHWSFYFEMGAGTAPTRVALLVPTTQTAWPLTVDGRIDDPFYDGSFLAVVTATFGNGVESLPLDERISFAETSLTVEPSLIAELYRHQIDHLRLIHDEEDDEYVGGDLIVRGGYNFDVLVAEGVLSLSPVLGGGELGRFVGTLDPNATSFCLGALLNISGILANPKGEFEIKGGEGVQVVNLPDEHKIQLRIRANAFPNGNCE